MDAPFTNMRSLLGAFAEAMNLIDPNIENHHQQTAYMSFMISREAGMSDEEVMLTVYASLLHDIGSIMFETSRTLAEIESQAKEIALAGSQMLSDLPGGGRISNIIKYCQNSWRDLELLPERERIENYTNARISSVIHLSDVVSALIDPKTNILDQVKRIRGIASSLRGVEFSEEAVDSFLRVSEMEYVWLDLRFHPAFLMIFTGDIRPVSLERTAELTKFVSRVIDYRSPFTAMHSAGVSASAGALASLCGMSAEDCTVMTIAGHLHDVGKLKVPRSILEKPGKLTEEEFNMIKEHPYNTRLILFPVDGFTKIADWAGFHHEKLNGKGYPFHFGDSQLDLGSRVMAVADIFSAVTELRPYRVGMKKDEALKALWDNVRSGGICGDVVRVLEKNYDEVNRARETASATEGRRYYESVSAENGKV